MMRNMSATTEKSYSNCPLKKRPVLQVIVQDRLIVDDGEDDQPVDLSARRKQARLSNLSEINQNDEEYIAPQYSRYQHPLDSSYLDQRYDHRGSPSTPRESSISPPVEPTYAEYHRPYHVILNHNNNVIKEDQYTSDRSMISPASSHLSYSSLHSNPVEYSEPEDLSFNRSKDILRTRNSSANIQRSRKDFSERVSDDLYYQCHSCSKCYSTQAGLVKHQQCHALPQDLRTAKCNPTSSVDCVAASKPISYPKPQGAPRYQCADCGKSYSTYSGLTKHQQFHCPAAEGNQVKKFFSCKNCDKVYVSLGALKMHIRTHTLPCKCPLCGKAFSRPWLLQGHIRTHTGEKPFSCQHCHRAFADRSNLRAHLQTHSDVKKYSCQSCAKTFSRMSLLGKHLQGGCPGNPISHNGGGSGLSQATSCDYGDEQTAYYSNNMPASTSATPSYQTITESDYSIRRDYSRVTADQYYSEDVHVY